MRDWKSLEQAAQNAKTGRDKRRAQHRIINYLEKVPFPELEEIIGVAKEIKTKFPASKFRQNLVICLDETYEKIRKSIKNELSHAISLCIQV